MATTNVIQPAKAKLNIKENRYCLDSWAVLLKEAQESKIDESREFFEEVVTQFPTCARFWKIYIEQEMKIKNYENVKKLFDRCLDKVLHIDLWKCYLAFIRETIQDINTICEAFELAIEKIGLDVMSYAIWLDYINYLKAFKMTNDEGVAKIREIYRKGVLNPMINVEQFWKDYCAFENKVNSENAKILIEELSKEIRNVKRVAREYENVTRPLERHLAAIPPNGSNEEIKQICAWKRYIAWEKQNPLKSSDQLYIIKRVMFAYEQSFLCLAYHNDIWCEATNYLNEQILLFYDESELAEKFYNDTVSLYERATNSFMSNSILFHFAYAEFEESRTNYDKAKKIYEKCMKNQNLDFTLVMIQYMRFTRRSKGIKAAREIFKLGREDNRVSYQLYIAAADMEYYCTKDRTVAFKIFQLGAKKFPNSHEFMLSYIQYMSHLNEDNNTRVLFERILSSNELPREKTNEIWSEFLRFECFCGDLASILKVDKKRQKAIESTPDFDKYSNTLMIDRYKFLDLLPCNQMELKSMGYKDLKPIVSLNIPQLNIPIIQQPKPQTSTVTATTTPTITTPTTTTAATTTTTATTISNGIASAIEGTLLKPEQKYNKNKYPAPDESQMLPFKPIRNALPGMHVVTGGVFPFPPSASELVKKLPPPHQFLGPFVIIDEFLKRFAMIEIPDHYQPHYVYITGESIKEMEPVQHHPYPHKRTIQAQQPDSDEEDAKKTKLMDIYKQRQHKKLAKS